MNEQEIYFREGEDWQEIVIILDRERGSYKYFVQYPGRDDTIKNWMDMIQRSALPLKPEEANILLILWGFEERL